MEKGIIKRGSGICVISFIFDLSSVMKLKEIIDDVFDSNKSNLERYKDKFVINYYKNIGNDYSIDSIYSRNLNSTYCFEKNSEFFPIISGDRIFSEKDKYNSLEVKNVIFEVLCSDETNIVDFRYLLLAAKYCKSVLADKGEVQFRVSNNTNVVMGYKPIPTRLYFQMRTFSLFSEESAMIYYLVDYGDNGKKQWQKAFGIENISERIENESDKAQGAVGGRSAFDDIGRAFPLIYITKPTYFYIKRGMVTVNLPDYCEMEKKVFETVLEKYRKKVEEYYEGIDEYMSADNFLERLIFFAMCLYLKEEGERLDEEKKLLIHERCVDFAQGIEQAVENAFFHAGVNEEEGCAAFNIRIRKSQDIEYYNRNEDKVDYFIEIYVTDLLYDSEKYIGIVGKFIENAKKRYENLDEKNKQEWKVQELNPKEWKETDIKLDDMFRGGDPGSIYSKYLSRQENVAYHYGLQIFNNVVSSNSGYLGVWSKEVYHSSINNEYKNLEMHDWNGTSYVVYIPVKIGKREISYEDTLGDGWIWESEDRVECKDLCENFEEAKKIFDEWQNLTLINSFSVSEYSERIRKVFANIHGTDSEIYIFDCYNLNRICYEILAKAIFTFMTHEDVYNIALINLLDKNEVIKLFRQFALFYNREGQNVGMENKNVYLIDRFAEMDISFGGCKADVIAGVKVQLIWGGIGESVLRIVKCLGE